MSTDKLNDKEYCHKLSDFIVDSRFRLFGYRLTHILKLIEFANKFDYDPTDVEMKSVPNPCNCEYKGRKYDT